MNITDSGIEFDGLDELTTFLERMDLYGSLRLIHPVEDKSGKVLIKEKINIKQGMIEKLRQMEGQYQPLFQAEITDDLLKRIAAELARTITSRLETIDNDFIEQLYAGSTINYRSYILQAIRPRKIALLCFKLSMDKSRFFLHLADMGLLALGMALLQPRRFRMMYRYAFLAGLLADMGLANSDSWKQPLTDNGSKKKAAELCAEFARQLHLTPQLAEAVAGQYVITERSLGDEAASVLDSLFAAPPTIPDNESGEDDEDGVIENTEEMDANTADIVAEISKIARFIFDIMHAGEKAESARSVLHKLAYNTARGYFQADVTGPVIARFREYERDVRKLMRIALLEGRCLKPPAAWAYPKPNSAQILCKDRVHDCPNMISGWDIHVVSPQDAFGRIGTMLAPGNYPKCKLEKEIQAIDREFGEI